MTGAPFGPHPSREADAAPSPALAHALAHIAELERVLRPFVERWCVEEWRDNMAGIHAQPGRGEAACISIATVYGHVIDARQVLARGLANNCPTCGAGHAETPGKGAEHVR